MNKPAEKAGAWYEGENTALQKEVDDCLLRALSQYAPALDAATGKPAAVVVPHAGLAFSGPLAALAFELVRRQVEKVDAFVIFGACHRERLSAPAVWPDGAWDTPMGPVPVDEQLAAAIIAAGAGVANTSAHMGDNAIELQMPFIKRMFPEAKIVPIAMGFFPNAAHYGELAAKAAKKHGGTIVAAASTDLTHYGASFGVMPAGTGEAAQNWARENDARFLNALVDMKLDSIVPVASRDGSACGAGAAAAAAGWARELGCVKGRLLARTDSHEIMPRGRAEHFVGYGAVAFEA